MMLIVSENKRPHIGNTPPNSMYNVYGLNNLQVCFASKASDPSSAILASQSTSSLSMLLPLETPAALESVDATKIVEHFNDSKSQWYLP